MGKIIFILGGARSGKSTFALQLAKKTGKPAAFIATCPYLDREMRERIKRHQENRPRDWQTFEEERQVSALLKKRVANFEVVVLDCLTLLLSNLLHAKFSPKQIEAELSKILQILKSRKGLAILVANEVGLGIVPATRLGRDFRDLAGQLNQLVAEKADIVFFMLSGLPLKIKGAR
jgi:adenosylcobinamide kinase/adenosylcobinamide-phosphate guanylyltransferase